MKVILLIPVYNSVKFLGKLFYNIHKLDPKPDFIYFLENNSKDDTINYIYRNCKIPFKLIRIWFRKDAVKVLDTVYDTIGHCRQLLLTAARNYNPDYAIFIDDDVYPIESDFITKLLQWNEDIIGGTYIRFYPEGLFVASKWGSVYPGKYLLKKESKVGKPCDFPSITSGGCLALSRNVIQDRRLDFYPVTRGSEDYGYCLKAKDLGYKLILDNSTKLYHEYRRTIEDVKPWTKRKGEYMKFEY